MDQRHETTKTVRKTRINLHDLRFGSRFLDMTLKTRAAKEKIDTLDFNSKRMLQGTPSR